MKTEINLKRNRFYKNYRFCIFLSSFMLILNEYYLNSFMIAFISLLTFFSVCSFILGEWISRIIEINIFKPLVGFSFFIIFFNFPGAIFIDIYKFSKEIAVLILVSLTIFILLLSLKLDNIHHEDSILKEKQSPKKLFSVNLQFTNRKLNIFFPTVEFIVLISFCVLIALGFSILIGARTTSKIHILWNQIPSLYILVYFLLTLFLGFIIFSSFSKKRPKLVLLLIIVHSFMLHSYVPIVYGTIYGGDQWWHMANEQQILETGVYGPVFFGDGEWKRLNRSEILQGQESGKLFITILGINIPYSLVSTKLSYSQLYAFSLSLSYFLNIDVFFNYWLLVFICWSLIVPTMLYNIGFLISKSEKVSLLLPLLSSFFYFLNFYGSITVPISLGILSFFPSLFIWLNFSSKGNLSSLIFSIALTFMLFFGYSLVFILSVMIGVITLLIRISDRKKGALKVLPFILVVFLIPIIPLLDTLESRSSFKFQFLREPVNFIASALPRYFVNKIYAFTFVSLDDPFCQDVKWKIPNQMDLFLYVTTMMIWCFIVYGALVSLKEIKNTGVQSLLVFFAIVEVNNFIVWYLMDAPHPIGLRLGSFTHILMLFYFTLGLVSSFKNLERYTLVICENKIMLKRVIQSFIILLIALGSTTFYMLNPIGINIADYEMAAINYINKSHPGGNYAIITTHEAVEFYLRKITANRIIGGNFRIYSETIEGVAFERSFKDIILEELLRDPSIELMEKALDHTINNASIIYLLVDSSENMEAVRRCKKVFGTHITFGPLYIFKYEKRTPHKYVVVADDEQTFYG